MSDQFQTQNKTSNSQSNPHSDQDKAEFERLYQVYINKYHSPQNTVNQDESLANPAINIAKKAFGNGINVFKVNFKNIQDSINNSNNLVEAIESGQDQYLGFGKGLQKKSQYSHSQVLPAIKRRSIPVVTQQARDRIKGFKAKLDGVEYQSQSNFLQPVPVRIIRQQESPIAWLTMGDNNLSRPEFDPYQQNDEGISRMSGTLWPLSEEIFERPKDNAILKPEMMNGLIYEQPKKPLSQRFGNLFANFKLPKLNPFRNIPKLQISKLSIALFLFSSLFAGTVWASGNTDLLGDLSKLSPAQIAGATEKIPEDPETVAFNEWMIENAGSIGEKDGDFDSDQLTNFEEFKLGTDPANPNTCDPDKTDIEVLLELRNPISCEALDMENEEVVAYYSYVLSIPNIMNQMGVGQEQVVETETGTVPANTDLISIFGVANYAEIDSLTIEQLEQEMASKNDKVELLKTIDKIDKYVARNRSFEIYDRNYEPPVSGAVYLEVSRKYNVPLKYVLTIARLESRFGTDRFTNNGNLTRPGQHQNIYSMGLTDGGSNITYKSWEDGAAAFGKWYQRLEGRGVKDCTKWKIYNPNGDYCSKVENLAGQIQAYLES